MQPIVKFQSRDPHNFFPVLSKRVNAYFKSNNIKKSGNVQLYIKTAVMLSLFLVPFVIVLTIAHSFILVMLCYFLMGLGISGIGLCVMHDANHGSFSDRKWVNNLLSYSMNLIGGSSFTWKIQHNTLHHTYTNIYSMDEDIHDKPFLRLSPNGKLKKHHRFQHIYAIALYSFATLSWLLFKDFKRLALYNKNGMTARQGFNAKKETYIMIVSKFIFFFSVIGLPVILGANVLAVILGFLLMHMVSGIYITTVFQLAHVVEGPDHHTPPENGKMENTWVLHQLNTTANFSRNNKIITWMVGGLNYQIEHHLFPTICHVHYPQIAEIVKATSEEFGLPYHEYTKFRGALASHLRQLKKFGQAA